MEAITNRKVSIQLDDKTGILCLANLLANTRVYVYDNQGELAVKQSFIPPSLHLMLPAQGVYVLVLSHPSCPPEVRRIFYRG